MKPRLFAEIPAGLASVSLRLHGGPKCRPPISRMGNKAGYAEVILAALGLDSGSGAGAYLWVEADPDARALLCAYPDGAMLQRIAAIIRGWADEEPRALWERLRAERKERGPREDAEGTAGWAWIMGHENPYGTNLAPQYDGVDRGDRWSQVMPSKWLADRCDRLAAHTAGTALLHRWSFSQKGPEFGHGGPGTDPGGYPDRDKALGCGVIVAPRVPRAADVADLLGTPGDLDGVVVYADPPYENTTGYRDNLTRAEVVAYAADFAALGAVVCVSEAVAIPELVAMGWHSAEITEGRKGQKRTFSAQKQEWITMNREPSHRVAVQASLWGAA